MPLAPQVTESLVFSSSIAHRFTQDSPVLGDVWIAFGKRPADRHELLLTPYFGSRAGQLSAELRADLQRDRASGAAQAHIAYNQVYVAAELDLRELVEFVLPRTTWWRWLLRATLSSWAQADATRSLASAARLDEVMRSLRPSIVEGIDRMTQAESNDRGPTVYGTTSSTSLPPDLAWFVRLLGAITSSSGSSTEPITDTDQLPSAGELFDLATDFLGAIDPQIVLGSEEQSQIWLVNLNRPASTAITRSRPAIKADAAERLFQVRTGHIAWAIIDSGVDASHPAFLRRAKQGEDEEWWERTRVVRTFDFTRIRRLLDPVQLEEIESRVETLSDDAARVYLKANHLPGSFVELLANQDRLDQLHDLKRHLLAGRAVDWELLQPFIEIEHGPDYLEHFVPASPHGTHVAGILGASTDANDLGMVGVCPDIEIFDLRVLDPGGPNDEFAVLAALQFVQWLNNQKDHFAVHGVNLSLSIKHAVANFACGRTPVCDQCEELVASGVVVVAAAGNDGYLKYQTQNASRPGITEGYHTVSITDPGNAEGVITVGSTHRFMPHTYGVSYFSSRGPTGDGRSKPDLVAPGEKITSTVPGRGTEIMDGTSMAAPHVSGAAAMLMARYSEMIGDPARIKSTLCTTATDLGRERYFQGAGMLDVLRAMQSI